MERWEAYHAAQESAIVKIQNGLKLSKFLKSLPPAILRSYEKKEICEALHRQFVEASVAEIRSSCETLTNTLDLQNLLNSLDRIVAETKNDPEEFAWRPCRNAADNLAAHDTSALAQTQNKLENDILSELESEVGQLNTKVNNLSDVIASKANLMNKMIEEITDSKNE